MDAVGTLRGTVRSRSLIDADRPRRVGVECAEVPVSVAMLEPQRRACRTVIEIGRAASAMSRRSNDEAVAWIQQLFCCCDCRRQIRPGEKGGHVARHENEIEALRKPVICQCLGREGFCRDLSELSRIEEFGRYVEDFGVRVDAECSVSGCTQCRNRTADAAADVEDGRLAGCHHVDEPSCDFEVDTCLSQPSHLAA